MMSGDLTRRHLLTLAGASAAAGFGAAGCTSDCADQRPCPPADAARVYVSRPDLTPPAVTVARHPGAEDSRLILLDVPYSGPGRGGTLILDSGGEVTWFGPNSQTERRLNFAVQSYRGNPVLTWFQGLVVQGYGRGELVIADSSYQVQQVIRPEGGELADFHDFVITPEGHALITIYRQHAHVDLSAVGGPPSGYLISGVAQEIEIETGKLLFEWDSKDHVPVHETYQELGSGDGGSGTRTRPFNYFHINSLALDADGDLLISSRNTWTVYKVRRDGTGAVVWRLNGKKSNFTMGPGSRFSWQHDARPHPGALLTVFDNGASPAEEERRSRALILDVNRAARHVTLRQAFAHPGRRLVAAAMGSAQLLPDGLMVVGWGTEPEFSVFAPDGHLLLDGRIANGAASYRAVADHWIGHPAEPPAAAVRRRLGRTTVYASWNGETTIASWAVLAGPTRDSLAEAGSAPRSGFETSIEVRDRGPYFAVEARDARRRVLARSRSLTVP